MNTLNNEYYEDLVCTNQNNFEDFNEILNEVDFDENISCGDLIFSHSNSDNECVNLDCLRQGDIVYVGKENTLVDLNKIPLPLFDCVYCASFIFASKHLSSLILTKKYTLDFKEITSNILNSMPSNVGSTGDRENYSLDSHYEVDANCVFKNIIKTAADNDNHGMQNKTCLYFKKIKFKINKIKEKFIKNDICIQDPLLNLQESLSDLEIEKLGINYSDISWESQEQDIYNPDLSHDEDYLKRKELIKINCQMEHSQDTSNKIITDKSNVSKINKRLLSYYNEIKQNTKGKIKFNSQRSLAEKEEKS